MPNGNRKEKSPAVPLQNVFILDQCALIEMKCAEIYRHFAHLTADIPELETLWKKTALEEEHHAIQFRMLGRLKEGIAAIKPGIAEVTAVVQKLERLFKQVKESRLTPVDTLRLGVKLEKYLSRYHANSVVVCEDPEMHKLLNAMMNIDVDHAEMLQKALDRVLAQKEGEHYRQ